MTRVTVIVGLYLLLTMGLVTIGTSASPGATGLQAAQPDSEQSKETSTSPEKEVHGKDKVGPDASSVQKNKDPDPAPEPSTHHAQHADDHAKNVEHSPTDDHAEHHDRRDVAPPLFAVFPFAGLLLAIALLPLFHKTAHWWEKNSSKLIVSVLCAVATFVFYAVFYGHGVHDHSTHALTVPGVPAALTVLKNAIIVEYIPFIVLLFSLYVIAGGINITGEFQGTPMTNTSIMLIGSVLSSFVGTTGAAMVLIRPLLKANANREKVAHTVVFFIFLVCNTGGCLLPIGDPPLFLGYLRGVPFFWTLHLAPHWAFMNLSILVIYFAYDSYMIRKDRTGSLKVTSGERFAIRGALNVLFLVGVIAGVALLDPSKAVPGTSFIPPIYLREGVMLALVGLSLLGTKTEIRKANSFNYSAILEVAILFIGIFVCMQSPIQILNVHGSALRIDEPWKFYWCTGLLSSFLDNAPTYVVFFETAKTVAPTSELVAAVGIGFKELAAISLGAVFMGSMTYIGNGPNLMVKAIAETSNVRMPSFFGYMVYSCLVVLPTSIFLTLIFFR